MSNDIRFRHKRDFQSYPYWGSETDACKSNKKPFFWVILQESKLENNILLEKTVALKQNTYIDVKYRIN